jgi:hypothetical protein
MLVAGRDISWQYALAAHVQRAALCRRAGSKPTQQSGRQTALGKKGKLVRSFCPAQKAARPALVGLLTPEPRLTQAFSSLPPKRQRQWPLKMGRAFLSRSQRRGRPGFAPVFPVRRSCEPARPTTNAQSHPLNVTRRGAVVKGGRGKEMQNDECRMMNDEESNRLRLSPSCSLALNTKRAGRC